MEPSTGFKTQFWLDQANGSRFLVGENHRGSNGEPYVVLRLAPDDPKALPFRQIALGLYDQLKGAILCHEDGEPFGDDEDFLLVYYGDVVDVLMTGRLWDRTPWTLGWGCPNHVPIGYTGAEMSEPSAWVLPYGSRHLISLHLITVGVQEPRVSLMSMKDGRRSLVFNGLDGDELTEGDLDFLGWHIAWCLPRHYAACILQGGTLCRYPLLPGTEAAPLDIPEPAPEAAPRRSACDKPRRQHYLFAHHYLREKIEGMPGFEIDHLRGGTAEVYLLILWETTGHIHKAEEDEWIPSDDLALTPLSFDGGWTGVIVRFPPPMCQGEAFFAAAVYKGTYLEGQADPLPYRYVTLELGEWSNQTVLGEWIGGSHFNLGEGPEPDESSFAGAVAGILAEENGD